MKMAVDTYWVILGDLIRSRTIRERDKVQAQILSALEKVNRKFKEDIFAPIKITRGDEISGVLLTVKNLVKILTNIADAVMPSMLRFVVVKGELSAGLRTKDASLIDGPAFHTAEKEMERQKSKNIYLLVFRGNNDSLDGAISLIGTFLMKERLAWTTRQREIVKLYDREKSQKRVAEILGISQQSVSVALERAHYYLVKEAENWLENQMKNYI